MKTIKVTYGKNLFGQFVIGVYHDALGASINVAHKDPSELGREVERLIAGEVKEQLRKYLSMVRNGRLPYLNQEDRRRYHDLNDAKAYLRENMRLQTVQAALKPHLTNIGILLPRRKSKHYPSQLHKYEFFQAICAFQLKQIDRLITVPSNPAL